MKWPHINADDGITMLTAAGTCRMATEADFDDAQVRLLPAPLAKNRSDENGQSQGLES